MLRKISQGSSSLLKAESKPSCFNWWNTLVSSLCGTGTACLQSALRLFERVQEMYPCESWTIRKAERWRIGAFELWCWRRFLKSLLDCKTKPVNPKGNQPWIFIGRIEAEALILWLPDAKKRLTGKDPDAGKDWRQEEKGATEVEMVGWHLRLNRHEFEQIPGDGEGQGSLACCSPWGPKESDRT